MEAVEPASAMAVLSGRGAERPVMSDSAKARSPAESKRSVGDFSRQCAMIAPMPGAASSVSVESGAGSDCKIAVMRSAGVGPSNARRPVSIS